MTGLPPRSASGLVRYWGFGSKLGLTKLEDWFGSTQVSGRLGLSSRLGTRLDFVRNSDRQLGSGIGSVFDSELSSEDFWRLGAKLEARARPRVQGFAQDSARCSGFRSALFELGPARGLASILIQLGLNLGFGSSWLKRERTSFDLEKILATPLRYLEYIRPAETLESQRGGA